MCVYERDGESCGATSDCGGLRCIHHVCTSGRARGPAAATYGDRDSSGSEWMQFGLQGVHPFVGVSLMGGPALFMIDGAGGGGSTVAQAFLFGLRGGVFVGKNEIALEISPMTYLPAGQRPSFQLNASYGYLFRISESPGGVSVYWPIRVGLGVAAGNLAGNARTTRRSSRSSTSVSPR
jgi:hypothetical protein